MLAYSTVGAVLFLLVMALNCLVYNAAYYDWAAQRWGGVLPVTSSAWSDAWYSVVVSGHGLKGIFLSWSLVMMWPVTTLLSLLIFRISMKRAKVRTVHMRRCVAYSIDLVNFVFLCLMFQVLPWLALLIAPSLVQVTDTWQIVLNAVACLSGWYRLWMALRLYLRFEHAFLTASASQIIAFLVVANIYGYYTYGL